MASVQVFALKEEMSSCQFSMMSLGMTSAPALLKTGKSLIALQSPLNHTKSPNRCTDNNHVLSQANTGSSGFRRNEDLDCADNAPAGHLTCTNAFRDGYGKCGSSFSPHEQPSCGVQVFNADGTVVGDIFFVGACLPPISPP
ncbi:hypothetical protein FPOAC2_03889 [Fusarium poae]